jgi:hypothetical protein
LIQNSPRRPWSKYHEKSGLKHGLGLLKGGFESFNNRKKKHYISCVSKEKEEQTTWSKDYGSNGS